MPQRPNETQQEYAQRRHRKLQRRLKRARRMHEVAADPKDLYADGVSFNEDRGILRIGFYCTRPDSEDVLLPVEVPVARLSFNFKIFKYRFEEWLKSEAGLDALSE